MLNNLSSWVFLPVKSHAAFSYQIKFSFGTLTQKPSKPPQIFRNSVRSSSCKFNSTSSSHKNYCPIFPRVSPRAFWTTLLSSLFFPRWRVSITIRTGQQMTLCTAYTASRRTHERVQASLHLRGAAPHHLQLDTSQGVLFENGVAARRQGTMVEEEIKRAGRATLTGELRVFGEKRMRGRGMSITRDLFSFSGSFLPFEGSVFHAENTDSHVLMDV